MELRQLHYFVQTVQHRSLGQAALALGISTSALSQQINKLEGELSTRLLVRTSSGVVPTNAGLAFLHHAQLILKQTEHAKQAAQREKMGGYVSVGLPPTTSRILAVPLITEMKKRYPTIQLHLVEMLSGYLAQELIAKRIELAVLFQTDERNSWSTIPLIEEKLFVIGAPNLPGLPRASKVQLADLGDLPLAMPSRGHGLRESLMTAFGRAGGQPNVVMEIDGLAVLMDAVRSGLVATIQPGAAASHSSHEGLHMAEITDVHVGRKNLLVSLSDDELSPTALAARVTITQIVHQLVKTHQWPGATLLDFPPI